MSNDYFYGYYVSFDRTGDTSVDGVLAAVASAARAYHHTEHWHEPSIPEEGAPSYVEAIQGAANRAAIVRKDAIDRLRSELAEATRLLFAVEWGGHVQGEICCPMCFGEADSGHEINCSLRAFLARTAEVK